MLGPYTLSVCHDSFGAQDECWKSRLIDIFWHPEATLPGNLFFQALFSCSSKFQKGHKTRQNVLDESSFTFFVFKLVRCIPSRELTYPPQGTFEDDFPFPKVGHVSSLEGIPRRTGVISPCLAGWKTWSCLDNSTVTVKHWISLIRG